ncbi:MAG: nuclear transport factor 2 family protein [Candidatus Dormibacteria bacterium]
MTIPGNQPEGRRHQDEVLIDAHLRALAESDVDALLGTVADNIEYDFIAGATGAVRGKDAVRAHHLTEFANVISERWIPLRRLYGEGFVVDEVIWEGRITGRLGALVGKGRRVSQRVLRIFEIRNGQVSRQSIYSDHAAVARQLP